MKSKLLVFALMFLPLLAQAGDYEITVERKKDAPGAATGARRLVTSQNWTGDVKVRNHAFKASPDLEAKYIIFVKRQQIGQKEGQDTVEKVKGSSKVISIKPGAQISFSTSDVPLHKGHMAPGWVPAEGGKETSEDAVIGIWLRLYSGANQVAEYVNPSTVTTKFKWE
ncbi:MAG: hypothetical protein PHQ12_12240 [Chthoniobacteraceae bacterium]|nr:hypothetical protein [Chthoniobacteraceae bacterium]